MSASSVASLCLTLKAGVSRSSSHREQDHLCRVIATKLEATGFVLVGRACEPVARIAAALGAA